MKHTPGPWIVGRIRANGFINVRSSDNRTVAEVLPQLPTETQENATLISLAPNMFEALKDILCLIDNNVSIEAMINAENLLSDGSTLGRTRAIIDKIEGGK